VALVLCNFLCWAVAVVGAAREVNLPILAQAVVRAVAAARNAVLCFRLGPYQMYYTFQLVRAVRAAHLVRVQLLAVTAVVVKTVI
jgi:hypothetical protein